MEYRTLAHTDLKVSRLSFGNMTFGSQTDEAAAFRIVDRCLEAGINFYDTANIYNQGLAETILGQALRRRRAPGRDRIFVDEPVIWVLRPGTERIHATFHRIVRHQIRRPFGQVYSAPVPVEAHYFCRVPRGGEVDQDHTLEEAGEEVAAFEQGLNLVKVSVKRHGWLRHRTHCAAFQTPRSLGGPIFGEVREVLDSGG